MAVSSFAISKSTLPVKATIPPKALSGSQSSAFSQASFKVFPSATPQGFVCLIITAAFTS